MVGIRLYSPVGHVVAVFVASYVPARIYFVAPTQVIPARRHPPQSFSNLFVATMFRPAFGKRVLVKFDGIFYPGTIHTDGESARDRRHSQGRWSVLFDDCTRDRFEDNASDGECKMILTLQEPDLVSVKR